MSLLKRAKQIRRNTASDASADDLGIVFDSSSGISEEDQKDILSQIESVARKNRISAAPEALTVKARKRGVVFPVVVNIGAYALLAAGLFTLSSFFRQSETEIRRESAGIRSAEGRLIQEIKKETEARIRAKEAEITSITARLGEIDRERRDLQSNMDARVMQKEEELRAALEAELAEERKRLTAQGLSEAVIAEHMKKFEEQKTAEFNAELAAFKTQVEAERIAAENNLRKLQADFQTSLVSLNNERAAILTDSRKREDALRAQLEERTRALQSADAESRERLSQAQAELRRLGEQKERAALVENQILGFYSAAGNHLRAGGLAEARETLAAMKNFLNEPSVLAIPEIQTRRAVDLSVADALMSMIDENLLKTRQSLSISQALQTGPLIDEIRKTTAEADAARQAGDIPAAERLYTAALSRVPEVLASHEYFVRKLQAEEAARLGALQEALTGAETAFAAGNYPEAWDGYARVLEYLPLPRETGAAVAGNIRKTGYEILSAEQRDLESRSAAGLLAEGGTHFAGGRYEQAAAAYITLLQRYPRSEQTSEALAGIRRTVEAQNNLVESRGGAASSTLAALQAEKAAVEASLRRQNADLRSEYEARIAAMAAQIAELRKGPVVDAAAAPAVPQAAQEELRRLAAVEAEFGRVKSSYADYAAKEDGVIRAKGEAGIVEAKLLLDTFLASESMRTHFPGLDGRIKRYDRAFQTAGAGEALMQASDIAFRLSSYGSKAEMDRYLAAELARQRNNPEMKEYLETLQEFTR